MDLEKKPEELEHREVGDSIDPVAHKKLLRKIDLYLMPAIWVIYLFSYVDRTNIGLAKVAGMDKALGLTDNQYYLTVALFQVGYVIAEIPSNMVLSVSRPSIYVPTLMFLWGAIATTLAAVQTPTQLIAVRFVLGLFEAGFSPAVLFLISTWYRKQEQSKRFIGFLSAAIVSGAFGSIVSGAITSRIDGARGIAGWRWLFLVEGVATCGMALIAPFFLLDYPATSKKLTPEERIMASARLLDDGVTAPGHEDRIGHMRAFTSAVLNWRVWLLAIAYMTIIASLSLSYFYPTLINALGYTSTTAQFMTAPLFVVALVIALPVCFMADRMINRRAFFVAAVLSIGAIFCAVSAGVTAYIPRYVFLCFINSAIWTANPLALSYASTCLGPVDPETRAVALAIINGAGNLAQLYGSALFPATDGPFYILGFSVYAGCMFVGAFLYVVSYFLFKKFPFKPIARSSI
ncbi:MFS general substrate transporter [Thozetella sp. PMI_491]|nr:MFS general substrate transporter [Thozetella sp. PMI_491]